MTAVAVRDSPLPAGTRSTATSLELPDGVEFGEWLRIGERLDASAERVAWARGDWLVYGKKAFGSAADPAANASRRDREALQVAEAFPPAVDDPADREVGQRMAGVTWSHHLRLVQLVPDEVARETWLREVARHGWRVRELEERIVQRKITGPRPTSLSLRPEGEVVARFEIRAAKLGCEPKDLALEVLSLASQLDDPIGTLEAAGALREIGRPTA